MGSVIRDFYEIVVRTNAYGLTLTALNADAERFYKRAGFVNYGSPRAQPTMLLPAQAIIDLIENNALN